MGIFKHSPGCGCCGCYANCTSPPAEVDLVIPSGADTGNCGSPNECADVAGTYTLSRVAAISEPSHGGGLESHPDTGEAPCSYEGYFSIGADCPTYSENLYITFQFGYSGADPAVCVTMDVPTLATVWSRTLRVIVDESMTTRYSPSNWFSNEDCTVNLTFDVDETADDEDWGPAGFGNGCEYSTGDTFEINP